MCIIFRCTHYRYLVWKCVHFDKIIIVSCGCWVNRSFCVNHYHFVEICFCWCKLFLLTCFCVSQYFVCLALYAICYHYFYPNFYTNYNICPLYCFLFFQGLCDLLGRYNGCYKRCIVVELMADRFFVLMFCECWLRFLWYRSCHQL